MKRMVAAILVLGGLWACNESRNEAARDKIDSLGKKAGAAAEKLLDSAGEKGKRLKEQIEIKLDKDSTDR